MAEIGQCKMVSFGRKLKMPKRCHKPLLDHIRIVGCKKPLLKTAYIRKMRAILKMAEIDQKAWAIAHAKWSVWVKN